MTIEIEERFFPVFINYE